MPTPDLTPFATIPIVGWIMYRRIRRQFGRQPLPSKPPVARLVVLALASTVLVVLAFLQPQLPIPVAAGMLGGTVIAGINLRLTRFEWTPAGDFYYPHPSIGAALSLLLVGRLVYRYSMLGGLPAATGQPPALTPLTVGLLALLIGYYVTYAIGLRVLRQRHHPA